MIWKIIGFVLMSLYQYWVYSELWIGEEDVRDVKQVNHIVGDIESIECLKVTQINGPDTGKFQVVLKTGRILVFSPGGTIKDCEKFYEKFGYVFSHKKMNKSDDSQEVTRVKEQLYRQLTFDGYFIGSIPLQVSFDSHAWMPYEDMRRQQRNFVLWLSFSPIAMVVAVWLVRVNKIKMKVPVQ